MRYETVIRVIAESKMCVVPNKTFSAPPALPLARLASRSDELLIIHAVATSRMTADQQGLRSRRSPPSWEEPHEEPMEEPGMNFCE